MKKKRIHELTVGIPIMLLITAALMLPGVPGTVSPGAGEGVPAPVKITFGVLPAVQALPVFVAAEKDFFTEEGLEVELILFNSAMEKDVALTAGRIEGYFGDLITPMVLTANGTPAIVAAEIFNTTGKERMFAILSAPGAGDHPLAELAVSGIAGSSNTVIEYVADRIFREEGLTGAAGIKMIETKNIPIRLQMLLAGQVAGAVLPEPLVSLAEQKGARVVADDRGRGISPTVLAFRGAFLKEYPAEARKFIRAAARAAAFINENPEKARPIMNRNCRVPDSLKEKFAIPSFPQPTLPEEELVMGISDWLREKGVIRIALTYAQVVESGLLP
jgi:NitT/TauT family transport system substrate-binding protein